MAEAEDNIEHGASETPQRNEGAPIPQAGPLGRIISQGGIVFALGIVAAAAILIQEVVLRYFFNAPTTWAHETTIFLSGIAFLYGGLYCVSRDSHIRVVLIYDAIPPRARRGFDVLISFICALSSAMFAYAAWIMVGRAAFTPSGEFRLERSGSAWNPAFPGMMKIFLLIVLVVMAVQFLILTINYARGKR
ncbi:TRAP-type mannitol/chloroaromatic compound transport system, small permease component [Jannaschia seosinensis]|uniref:TRAP transporter small permease protein n=1 Tax=Jannaschia seosinensis TaxID=313367 RepID=A0A0M7B981_9RHOB|nr:TRAP transporter small permease subunit [Jannaschia seosinensis]CUH38720.1 TRAP-type mannitol/chloroaromatic compound transport system, small permease component [Jannaschia seosinensis]